MTDFRALCAELLAWAERTSAHYVAPPNVILRTRAALSAPEQGPTDEELDEMWSKEAEYFALYPEARRFARAVLNRWGRPAALPSSRCR